MKGCKGETSIVPGQVKKNNKVQPATEERRVYGSAHKSGKRFFKTWAVCCRSMPCACPCQCLIAPFLWCLHNKKTWIGDTDSVSNKVSSNPRNLRFTQFATAAKATKNSSHLLPIVRMQHLHASLSAVIS